ncbi:MAG: Thiopurine S-methyltransferase [Verrucomicrobiota bacterium]|jgi:SAM-dependent methyltransferase
MSESSLHPDFWNERYEAGIIPWDFGGVPRPLTRWLAANPGQNASVLIPGCGSGHEMVAFAAAGYQVTALDFSAAAVKRARRNLPSALGTRIVEGDFFTHVLEDAPFDVIYERTFLCALPPPLWPQMVSRAASLLKPGGRLVGLYFIGAKDDGPPFGLDPLEPGKLFDSYFNLMVDEFVPPAESVPLFSGCERWQERQRYLSPRSLLPLPPAGSTR